MRQTRTLGGEQNTQCECPWRSAGARDASARANSRPVASASGSQRGSHESWTVTDAGWSSDDEIRLVVTTTGRDDVSTQAQAAPADLGLLVPRRFEVVLNQSGRRP